MGFSLLLKIIMPLQGRTDGYDTAFSSSPLAGRVIHVGGVRTAAAHTRCDARRQEEASSHCFPHVLDQLLLSARREGIFVFPVTGQSTQEGANCSRGKKKKEKKKPHTSQMSLADCHELPKVTSLFVPL